MEKVRQNVSFRKLICQSCVFRFHYSLARCFQFCTEGKTRKSTCHRLILKKLMTIMSFQVTLLSCLMFPILHRTKDTKINLPQAKIQKIDDNHVFSGHSILLPSFRPDKKQKISRFNQSSVKISVGKSHHSTGKSHYYLVLC